MRAQQQHDAITLRVAKCVCGATIIYAADDAADTPTSPIFRATPLVLMPLDIFALSPRQFCMMRAMMSVAPRCWRAARRLSLMPLRFAEMLP